MTGNRPSPYTDKAPFSLTFIETPLLPRALRTAFSVRRRSSSACRSSLSDMVILAVGSSVTVRQARVVDGGADGLGTSPWSESRRLAATTAMEVARMSASTVSLSCGGMPTIIEMA